jgi:hypothetical protein
MEAVRKIKNNLNETPRGWVYPVPDPLLLRKSGSTRKWTLDGGLVLQVVGVSNEIIKYGHEFCGSWTREWLLWQGPEAIIQVNYRPILWSERVTKSWNPQLSDGGGKSGHKFQIGARNQDTLADWPSVAT